MNNKALTLSLVMAIVAVFFVQSYVQSIEDEEKKRYGDQVLVVTAKNDIKEMDTINETMLTFALVPKRYLQPAARTSISKTPEDKESTQTLKDLVGSIAVVPIKKGEQITMNKLTEPGMRTGLAPQVAPGKRGYAVPVNDMTGVAKLVKPGDRVDVIGVIDMGGGKTNKIAKILLQDVVVLATGKNINNNVARSLEADPAGGQAKIRSLAEDATFNSVTLEVDAAQAQMLALMVSGGEASISISLRNNDDSDRTNLQGTMITDVLGADIGKIRMPASQGQR